MKNFVIRCLLGLAVLVAFSLVFAACAWFVSNFPLVTLVAIVVVAVCVFAYTIGDAIIKIRKGFGDY